jgi:16S rRNA (guanine527-N7)-methyltransferase
MIDRRAPRPRSPDLSSAERLTRAAATLGVPLSPEGAQQLLRLTSELALWNRSYNLTAITDPQQMLTRHLLDSLAIHTDLHGTRIADVGTGAGFPGLPLALVNPARQFTLIDSSHKKIRFVQHAVQQLGLGNVSAVHARAEALRPETPFDTVVTRAFAALPQMLRTVARLCGADTRVLAMKGRWPEAELAQLPAGWRVTASRQLLIPGLEAARCLIALARSAPAAVPAAPIRKP